MRKALRKGLSLRGKKDVLSESEDDRTSSTLTTDRAVTAQPQPLSTGNRYGVSIAHDCPNALVDICFLHGLNGGRESTWTAKGQQEPWTKSLLPLELGRSRILMFGYNADVIRVGVAGTSRLQDHANDLLNELWIHRAEAPSRPLIFVAHSMGGLVCKAALLSAQNRDQDLRAIFDCTTGIIFMGTPHKGSWMANWASKPLKAISLFKSSNQSLVDVLQESSEYLESLLYEFVNLLQAQRNADQRWEVFCFYEELPLPGMTRVVDKDSAVLVGYRNMSIPANHMDMVRFSGPEDVGFVRVSSVLKQWVSKIETSLSLPPPDFSPCLKSLAFAAMNSRRWGIERADSGSCEWFLRHPSTANWGSCDEGGLLWIQGKPGSGKSTVLRFALEHQSKQALENNDVILSYFFHDRGEALEKTTMGFLRTILHQAVQQAPYAFSSLHTLYEKHCLELGEFGKSWRWEETQLRDLLQSCLPQVLKARSVWMFIDALDEAGERVARDMVLMFKSLLRHAGGSTLDDLALSGYLRICFSCRHHPNLPMKPGDAFTIVMERENKDDLTAYVKSRVSDWDIPNRAQLLALVVDGASGMFIWARLILERLFEMEMDGESWTTMQSEMKAIPHDMRALFRSYVGRICVHPKAPLSILLFQCVCCSQRPLKMLELFGALEIGRGDSTVRDLLVDKNLGKMKKLMNLLSCGLVETVGDEHVVQFIHQSAKDYFEQGGLFDLESSIATEDPLLAEGALARAHFQLARICTLAWFCKTELRTYARGDYWMRHATFDGVSPKAVLGLLSWPSCNILHRWCELRHHDVKPQSVAHFAAEKGFCAILEYILRHSENLESISGFSMAGPLHRAVLYRQVEAVRLFLDLGRADVNERDEEDRTLLSVASLVKADALVEMLLAREGVGVESKDSMGRTPLSLAAFVSWSAGVRKFLVRDDVNPDSRDNRGRTPLSWAASSYRLAGKNKTDNTVISVISQLLAREDVDPNAKDNCGRTPLSWAASARSFHSVQALLESGRVDADVRDNDNCTPLSWAVYGQDLRVAKLFLERKDVDPNARDKTGRTPLSWAASGQNSEIVALLLARDDIDADAKDHNGRTPLSWAACGENKEAVGMLRDRDDVDPFSKDNHGMSPLMWAFEDTKRNYRQARAIGQSISARSFMPVEADHIVIW